ncbi:reticulon-like protein B16 isoform X3 [Vigna angularis]|uniref:reticulon-like protein B16 isoform X3 n=1 Tax=Phaseolus angularis TaxID=3914 RepID=UPI0022B5DFCD|nr:reticulon-like protein B16 isoform X3 [Vigna angularis]XP_052722879.1 reticulon-like protein B16 isoform X3 [Vigna angularis]
MHLDMMVLKYQLDCSIFEFQVFNCHMVSSLDNSHDLGYLLCRTSVSEFCVMSESEAQLPTAFVADVLLWKRWHISLGVIVVATVAWIVFEWTNLPFLTICSDVLLILIVLLFLHANYAALRNKQPPTLPELVVSEEMVNNVAASFRVKINNVLLIAHDITIGKDFRIFFKVVICLWLLSVIGSVFSFFTLAYIGMLSISDVPNRPSFFIDVYSKHRNISFLDFYLLFGFWWVVLKVICIQLHSMYIVSIYPIGCLHKHTLLGAFEPFYLHITVHIHWMLYIEEPF